MPGLLQGTTSDAILQDKKMRLLAVGLLRLLMRSNRDDDRVKQIADAFGVDLEHAKDTGEEVE